jgi:DNA-binding CsgD family transcriptional regulator
MSKRFRSVVRDFMRRGVARDGWALLDSIDAVLKPHLGAFAIYTVGEPLDDQTQYVEGENIFYHRSVSEKLRDDIRKRLDKHGPSVAGQLAMLGRGPFTLFEAIRETDAKENIGRVVSELREYEIADMVYRVVIVPAPGRPMEQIKVMLMFQSGEQLILSDDERDDLLSLAHRAAQRFVKLIPLKRRRSRKLTTPETLLLQRLAYGDTTKTLAAELHITESALEGKVLRIRQKLGAKTRTHAVYIACQRRLLGFA